MKNKENKRYLKILLENIDRGYLLFTSKQINGIDKTFRTKSNTKK